MSLVGWRMIYMCFIVCDAVLGKLFVVGLANGAIIYSSHMSRPLHWHTSLFCGHTSPDDCHQGSFVPCANSRYSPVGARRNDPRQGHVSTFGSERRGQSQFLDRVAGSTIRAEL